MTIFIFLCAVVAVYLIYRIAKTKSKNVSNVDAKNNDEKFANKKIAIDELNEKWKGDNIDTYQLYNYLELQLSRDYPEKEKKSIAEKLKIELIESKNNLEKLNELTDEIKMLREYNIEELAEFYFKKAERYAKYGKTDNLQNYYSKAIDLVKSPLYFNNRACIYHQRNLFEAAIADYTQAINLDPDFGQYYYNRGGAYFALDKREEARNDWQKASDLGLEEAGNMLKIHFNNFFN